MLFVERSLSLISFVSQINGENADKDEKFKAAQYVQKLKVVLLVNGRRKWQFASVDAMQGLESTGMSGGKGSFSCRSRNVRESLVNLQWSRGNCISIL